MVGPPYLTAVTVYGRAGAFSNSQNKNSTAGGGEATAAHGGSVMQQTGTIYRIY